MMYLIVPPLIIVLSIAILIVFLSRTLTTQKRDNKKESVQQKQIKNKKGGKKGNRFQKSKNRLKEKSEAAVTKIKNTLEGVNEGNSVIANKGSKKVISLRKKSMVSDKMVDGEERDVEEITFMKKIESDPQNSKKYEALADYYMEHEKFEDARECYKYVLRLDPRHKRAQVAMKNLDRIL